MGDEGGLRPQDDPEGLSLFVDGGVLDPCRLSRPEGNNRCKQAADRAADHGATLRGGRPDGPAAGEEAVVAQGDDDPVR